MDFSWCTCVSRAGSGLVELCDLSPEGSLWIQPGAATVDVIATGGRCLRWLNKNTTAGTHEIRRQERQVVLILMSSVNHTMFISFHLTVSSKYISWCYTVEVINIDSWGSELHKAVSGWFGLQFFDFTLVQKWCHSVETLLWILNFDIFQASDIWCSLSWCWAAAVSCSCQSATQSRG